MAANPLNKTLLQVPGGGIKTSRLKSISFQKSPLLWRERKGNELCTVRTNVIYKGIKRLYPKV